MCKCNWCGREIPKYEEVSISHHYGYWSQHDMDRLQASFCSGCFDKLTDELISRCKINPIVEYEPPIQDGFRLLLVNGEIMRSSEI